MSLLCIMENNVKIQIAPVSSYHETWLKLVLHSNDFSHKCKVISFKVHIYHIFLILQGLCILPIVSENNSFLQVKQQGQQGINGTSTRATIMWWCL